MTSEAEVVSDESHLLRLSCLGILPFVPLLILPGPGARKKVFGGRRPQTAALPCSQVVVRYELRDGLVGEVRVPHRQVPHRHQQVRADEMVYACVFGRRRCDIGFVTTTTAAPMIHNVVVVVVCLVDRRSATTTCWTLLTSDPQRSRRPASPSSCTTS